MRKLMTITAEMLDLAASENGWQGTRIAPEEPDGAPQIMWDGPGQAKFFSDDPESLVEPLRQALRAELIGWLAKACPVCETKGRWLKDPGELQATATDGGRVSVSRKFSVVDGVEAEQPYMFTIEGWFAIEHAAECEARPEILKLIREADED